MRLLTNELAATTIVSVGHRPELEAFHSRKIGLERRRGGARFVTDINLTRSALRRPLFGRWRGKQRGASRGTNWHEADRQAMATVATEMGVRRASGIGS